MARCFSFVDLDDNGRWCGLFLVRRIFEVDDIIVVVVVSTVLLYSCCNCCVVCSSAAFVVSIHYHGDDVYDTAEWLR